MSRISYTECESQHRSEWLHSLHMPLLDTASLSELNKYIDIKYAVGIYSALEPVSTKSMETPEMRLVLHKLVPQET